MINEYIRYRIADPDRAAAFVKAYEEAGESLRASPHCLGYELSRCTEAPEDFILLIRWDSAEGHLEGFRKSAEFRTFFQAIRPFVGDIQEMRHYERTSFRWSRSAAPT
jgi:quinol monooxygenase YgiN